MCTLTVVTGSNTYRIAMNRDEKITRGAGMPPGMHAPSRPLGRVAVKNFREMAEPTICEMIFQRSEPLRGLPAGCFTPFIHLHIRSEERSHELENAAELVLVRNG